MRKNQLASIVILLALCALLPAQIALADVPNFPFPGGGNNINSPGQNNPISTTTFLIGEGIVVIGVLVSIVAIIKIRRKNGIGK
jgi:hypothetical protein